MTEELGAANAFMTISYTGAKALGSAAAGLIAARFVIGWAFALDALSFVLSAACIIGVRVAPAVAQAPIALAGVVGELRAGLRFVRDTAVLRSLLFVCCLLFCGFGLLNAVLLPFTARVLHAGAFEYGLIEGIPIFGFVLSSLLLAHLADRLHPGQWIAISLLGMGALQDERRRDISASFRP
jgi:Major Facilitator Superfamily